MAVTMDQDRVNRGLHVVVDATRAGALEKGECAIVRVEHHLLRLARIRPHKEHPAVAQPHVCHLHGDRHTVDQIDLVAGAKISRLSRLTAPCSALPGIPAPEADVRDCE